MVCPRTRARLRGEAGGFSNQGGADGRDDKAREGHAFLEGEEISTSKVVLEVDLACTSLSLDIYNVWYSFI
jgi:hypothetical protein